MGLIHEDKAYALKIRESADDGSDFSNPEADYRMLFLGEDGTLKTKDSAGTVATISGGNPAAEDVTFTPAGSIAATDVQAAIEEVAAEAGSSGFAGYVPVVFPPVTPAGNTAAAGTASTAYMVPINVPGPMKLRGFRVRFTNSGSGTFQFGLFSLDSTVTGATKTAGGTGSSPGTGWVTVAATGAPVDVPAGSYVIIFHNASANPSQIGSTDFAAGWGAKSQASYSWDDTPDLTTGWSTYQNALWIGLIGDMDGSGNQW